MSTITKQQFFGNNFFEIFIDHLVIIRHCARYFGKHKKMRNITSSSQSLKSRRHIYMNTNNNKKIKHYVISAIESSFKFTFKSPL